MVRFNTLATNGSTTGTQDDPGSMAAGGNLHRASREWATRPDDQRFLSLEDLRAAVERRKVESWTAAPLTREMVVRADTQADEIGVEVYDPTAAQRRVLTPTNYSFGQLASYGQAPASYLRKLPAQLAAINLQWGLEKLAPRENALVLGQSNGDNTLRAITSTSYGRIWDLDVVRSVEKANAAGNWKVPAASYATTNPRRATTLYASDRDVFIFLVDPDHPVEIPGDRSPMFRGFMVWNSEVGSATFGLSTFLYRYVCDNRIIWGASNVQEIRIRHTSGAPERFAYEGAKFLNRYAQESTAQLVSVIHEAKRQEIPINEGKGETVAGWLQSRGFTKAQSTAAVETAQAEEGSARSLWDVIQGVTAYARSVPNTDERTQLESRAGKLLDLAKAKV